MRVVVVTESYLPAVNGVTNSVVRVVEHLRSRGHETLVIAPGYPGRGPRDADAEVLRIPSAALRRSGGFRVGLPLGRLTGALRAFGPDVVHLASPVALGAHGAWSARRLGIPSVAVFQTDVAAFSRAYGGPQAATDAVWAWLRLVHAGSGLTLAPSRTTMTQLARRGIGPLALWQRGVDTECYSPERRDREWLRRRGIGDDETVVGYVGRLAPEKRLDDLAALAGLRGTRLLVVGDGPSAAALRRRLPTAVFTGHLDGDDLARAHAGIDVFVHTGRDETFCQAVQESMASAVPVVGVRAGAVQDLVESGRTGTLVRPGDLSELRAAVSSYVDDARLRRVHGRAGRRAVLGRSWADVGDELVGHYRAVTGLASRHAVAG